MSDPGIDVRLLPMGDSALLVELAGIDAVLALSAALADRVERAGRSDPFRRVEDVLPAARTVLVTARPGTDPGQLAALARGIASLARDIDLLASRHRDTGTVTIDVDYDGPDLAEVAELTGLAPGEVVTAHTGTPWRVAFAGFAPGFAYLVGGDARLQVPRRATPRTAVPSGSVGLAGEFSGIYPRESPGGWQLIGRTEAVLWDVDADPPALLRPGSQVVFRALASGRPRPRLEPPAGDGSTEGATRPGRRHPRAALEVLATGPRVLVEDEGRTGLASVGVGRAGAADLAAYRLGNRLLGNRRGRASLEVLYGGLRLRAHGSVTICLTGAPAPAFITYPGTDSPPREVGFTVPVHVPDGAELSLGTPPRGMRTYVAVRGGIGVPRVLGSRSTDVLSSLGPEFVTPGTTLPVGRGRRHIRGVDAAFERGISGERVTLRVEPGPRYDWFARPEALAETVWTVSGHSNRVGIRLHGEPLARVADKEDAEVPSEGMVRGAIQVPPSGEPVVFLNDHPLTGGYPVIGVVPTADMDLAAQLQPGQEVVFRWKPPTIAPP